MNEPSLVVKLTLTALMFAVACAFWLAYLEPAKNRVTRFLHAYVDATRLQPITASATTLLIAVITGFIAIASLLSIIVPSPWR